ncbi:MAG: hypothetical protein MJZ38_04320 [archaeon]|nr:hypothetical protein [archaeon]
MRYVPGPGLGEVRAVRSVPEGVTSLDGVHAELLQALEAAMLDFVPDAERTDLGDSLEYRVPQGVFVTVTPAEPGLVMVIGGDLSEVADDHSALMPMVKPMEGLMHILHPGESTIVAEDVLIASLVRIGYFDPSPEADPDGVWEDYVLTLTDGTYEGPLTDGRAHGRGRFVWRDGGVYEGDFIDGRVSGWGRYTRPSGDVFEGHFVDGRIARRDRDIPEDDGVYEMSEGWEISFDSPPMYL